MVPYSSSQSRCSTSAALEAAARRKEPCCTRPVHGENGLGQRAREGARSEKLLAHGRLQTPPRPRRALPPHPLQPPRRFRIAASAEVSGVSGVLRAGFFDLGTNQHCRWLFFVRRRVMGHGDDISAARRRGPLPGSAWIHWAAAAVKHNAQTLGPPSTRATFWGATSRSPSSFFSVHTR
jgi:hypothetical protein